MTKNEGAINKLSKLIEKYRNDKSELINCLQLVQSELGYIPEYAVQEIAETLNVPESDVYSVVTFYAQFTLRKKAKFTIEICLGTACYVLGADKIQKVLEKELNLKLGDKSKDDKFELVQSRCLGCCSMAPVIKINDKIYGNLTEEKTIDIINSLK